MSQMRIRSRPFAAVVFCLSAAISANSQVELDRETAAGLGNTPTSLTACVLGGSAATACPTKTGAETLRRVRLEWKPPPLGSVSRYEIYRYRNVTGDRLKDLPARVALCGPAGKPACGGTQTSFVDDEHLPNGTYVYFAVAVFDDGSRSAPSNFATITITE
jgi:hypothetical protein